MSPGALLRYREFYRHSIPDREKAVFLVVDSFRTPYDDRQYLAVLDRGEELHFPYHTLFMYEEVEG